MPGTMKLFCEGLTPDLVNRAERELGETDEIKTKTLSELKNLIQRTPEFYPCMDEAFLLRFLRVKKFHTNRAFELLQKYYRFKARYSGIVTDLKPSDVKYLVEPGHGLMLENRDPNDLAVGLFRLDKIDIKGRTVLDDLLATAIMYFEIGLIPEATQVVGCVLVADFTDISILKLKHLASPSFIYKVISSVQDCIPARIKAIHVVNEPFYFSILMKVVCMFLSEKLQKRIHIHGKNLSSLHKYVPPEILPLEYGGTLASMPELAKSLTVKVLSYEDHFIRLNKYGYRGQTLEKIRMGNC